MPAMRSHRHRGSRAWSTPTKRSAQARRRDADLARQPTWLVIGMRDL